MTQVTKANFAITEPGKELLGLLRENWGTEIVVRPKTRMKDGVAGIWPTEMEIDTPMKRLNRHLPTEAFHELGEYIKPEHVGKFKQLVESGKFEVEKALQVVKYAPRVADLSFQPDDWEEANAANSPSFATFCKYRGQETAVRLMVAMLCEVAEDFGRRSDITEKASISISHRLINKIKSLTLADFKLALNMLRNQPQRISNLDSQTVINFVKAFAKKKQELAAKQNIESRAVHAESVGEIAGRYEERKKREMRFDEIYKLYK